VPFEVSTLPVVPGATKVGLEVPLPRITLFAVSVFKPVPPPVTPNTVPFTKAPDAAIKLIPSQYTT
jgi:hypothetical protein